MILPPHTFYSRGPQTGPILFITDDSSAERNTLELCYPKAIRLLCTFHLLQAFWSSAPNESGRVEFEDKPEPDPGVKIQTRNTRVESCT